MYFPDRKYVRTLRTLYVYATGHVSEFRDITHIVHYAITVGYNLSLSCLYAWHRASRITSWFFLANAFLECYVLNAVVKQEIW